MNDTAYKTLYKSIGLPEWRLIVGEERKRFHPRLLTKPIFYPAFTFEYACKLAKDWNAIDHMSEYVGLVIGFDVKPDFMSSYESLTSSSADPSKLWVNVDDLYSLNQAIQGRMRVYEVYYGKEYKDKEYTPQDLNEESFLP